jgi:hypothetical protein
MGSNPTQGMDVCVCVVLCVGSGLATGWLLVKETYRLCKKHDETEEEARAKPRAVEPLMNEWNNYIECHSWEANCRLFGPTHEIPFPLRKPKTYYHVRTPANCPYPEQAAFSSHLYTSFKIHFNILIPSALRFTKRSLPFRFSELNTEYCTHFPPPLFLHDLIILRFGEEHSYGAPHSKTVTFAVTSSHLYDNMPLSDMFSNTVNMYFKLSVTQSGSHSHKTASKIKFWKFTLVFMFLL